MGDLSNDAKIWVRKNKKFLRSKFASPDVYFPSDDPLTFFMAGSPGAGKTEYSKGFIEHLEKEEKGMKIVRIDADEIRKCIPGYKLIFMAGDFGSPNTLDTVRIELRNPSDGVVYDTYTMGFSKDSSCVGTARTLLDKGNITIWQD